jgi:hypothetical protein
MAMLMFGVLFLWGTMFFRFSRFLYNKAGIHALSLSRAYFDLPNPNFVSQSNRFVTPKLSKGPVFLHC